MQIEAEYEMPAQHHNPIELFTTTAVWHGDELTLYEPSQFMYGLKNNAAQKLVSNGLLTRTGQQIKVGDPGFQKWVQTRLGVAAAQSGVVPASPLKAAVPTAQPTGDRAPEPRAVGQNRDLQANR